MVSRKLSKVGMWAAISLALLLVAPVAAANSITPTGVQAGGNYVGLVFIAMAWDANCTVVHVITSLSRIVDYAPVGNPEGAGYTLTTLPGGGPNNANYGGTTPIDGDVYRVKITLELRCQDHLGNAFGTSVTTSFNQRCP